MATVSRGLSTPEAPAEFAIVCHNSPGDERWRLYVTTSILRLGSRGCFRVHPSETPSQAITRLRADGLSYREIARALNEMHVPTRSGAGRWWSKAVADVLRKSVADAPDDPVARRAALVRRGRHAEASKEAVEQIIALRAAGLSYAAIAERLNHDGVATAQHAMRWQAGSVHRVLRRAAARRGDWPRLEQALNVGRGRREHPPRYERPWANPPEVREFILDRAREGLPLAKIVRELTRLDVPTARGGQWRISTVAAIVKKAERSNSQAAGHAATSLAQAQE